MYCTAYFIAPFWLKSKESEVDKSTELNEEEEGKDHSTLSEESIADKDSGEMKREEATSSSSTYDKVFRYL